MLNTFIRQCIVNMTAWKSAMEDVLVANYLLFSKCSSHKSTYRRLIAIPESGQNLKGTAVTEISTGV